MARPLRIELAGAVYLVSARAQGDTQVFVDDADRRSLLEVVAQAMHRFDAQVLAYTLTQTHYELLVFTRQANLARLMRHINGVYTQHHHGRHGSTGHVFRGRYKSLLVDRERHLLEACIHVDRCAVREGLVNKSSDRPEAWAQAWPWSSCAVHLGLSPAPDWLDVQGLHSHVAGEWVDTQAAHRRAARRYGQMLVQAAPASLDGQVRHQVFWGDAAFEARVSRERRLAARRHDSAYGLARGLRARRMALLQGPRDEVLYKAHTQAGVAMSQLAREVGLSVSRVSRLISAYEQRSGA
ncbi:MAG: transposase [Burkholderiaceae bacterium]|nr:transposase [Roseateles sp.]MBV8469402.1 transposase [Burkholderiaceae bacterium]